MRGDFATAWAQLSPQTRAQWGSLAAFSSERAAFFRSVAGRFDVRAWPTDVGPITDWTADTGSAGIDLAHAVLVEVTYPALSGNNAGLSLYIVSTVTSAPKIYEVR